MFAHDEFSVHVVSAHFGVEISHEELQVPFWSFVQDGLKLFVEVLFFCFVCYIGGDIALEEGDFPAFRVRILGDTGSQDSITGLVLLSVSSATRLRAFVAGRLHVRRREWRLRMRVACVLFLSI
jgi:hypothetical protein